ncbi:HAD family hydrolase [Paenibacillus rhizovicinus]|uniref:D,D-heptose 1,7-bisphosphate phosphatase n=1 Tax=Paenibacillus rhizovicinus TaxID=2704463 RepID=A0A6C0P952_9BACL|nr:HAD family hydrolase [Paenibacillus rhizovicinus]
MFLDRDGVINVEKNYVYRIEDFEFMDGILDVLGYFQEQGYLLIVITNQAGIGRGYYTEDDFNRLNDWMIQQLADKGIHITQVYYCPYHPEHGIGSYKQDSFDRKPNPGMLLKAVREYDINLDSSILIGDKESDIQAGKKAGVNKNVLLNQQNDNHNKSSLADVIIHSLMQIIDL